MKIDQAYFKILAQLQEKKALATMEEGEPQH